MVGPTGAGKTTMVKLLMRFYDVDAGAIRLGGTDIREFSRDRRAQPVRHGAAGYVAVQRHGARQHPLTASLTPPTPRWKQRRARRTCTISSRTLPHGYDTVINEDASNISAGQRQLLTIARAILADRRMLILDEATSSVDTRTEERIQKAMDNLMEGRTSFVIAHRLSTIKNADLILRRYSMATSSSRARTRSFSPLAACTLNCIILSSRKTASKTSSVQRGARLGSAWDEGART